jgi:leucyl aminopeptidase
MIKKVLILQKFNLCQVYNIDGVFETRNLVTKPSNILNPQNFVNAIKKLSKTGLKIEILDENKLKKLGMNALLGVGQGSSNKSFVAIMKWNGGKKNSKPLGFHWKRSLF